MIAIEEEEEICSICLDNLEEDGEEGEGKEITITNCNHIFHTQCLLKIRGNSCPNCRAILSLDNTNINTSWLDEYDAEFAIIRQDNPRMFCRIFMTVIQLISLYYIYSEFATIFIKLCLYSK